MAGPMPGAAIRAIVIAALLMPLGVLTGCNDGYTIEGRVVRGTLGMVTLVDPDDGQLGGTPVSGATVRAIRDPGRLSSREFGSAVSGADGTFRLRIDSIGAGLLREEWLITANRPGTAGAEGVLALPRNAGTQRLLVTLAAGSPPPQADRWGYSSDDLMRDYERHR